MTASLLDCVEIETGPNPEYAIIWLHGLGADGHDFAPIVPELRLDGAPAIRYVFPHAPTRSVTINNGMHMRAWYDIYTPEIVRREDGEGVRASQQAVLDLIARENARGIPTDHIVLAGFSQGCAMTLHTGLRLSSRLAGMIGLSGYLPLASSAVSERHDANQDTPIFLAHGTQDPVVDISRAHATRDALTDMGYNLIWKTYPMGHSVCAEEVADLRAFLRTIVK